MVVAAAEEDPVEEGDWAKAKATGRQACPGGRWRKAGSWLEMVMSIVVPVLLLLLLLWWWWWWFLLSRGK